MADVVLVCDDGFFKGLEFTVPDKDPFVYSVIKGLNVVVYQKTTQDGARVTCGEKK